MRSDRRSATLLAAACAALLSTTAATAQTPGLATVDAVRLRAAPSVTAAAVRTLEIATPLAVVESTPGAWVRVRTRDGAAGWVRRDLTVAYDAAAPLPALRTIAARSLARETAPFEVRARLANLLADAADGAAAPAAKAELSLLRLQALQAALDAHAASATGRDVDPVRTGKLRADTSELAYGDPQGQWFVRADAFWKLRERYRALPIAERIAWAAATHPLPGECELDPTCMFAVAETSAGRYLTHYPRGAHAGAALANILVPLGYAEEATRDPGTHAQFCTRSGAEYTLTPARITALSRIVAASAGAGRERASAVLRKLAARCV